MHLPDDLPKSAQAALHRAALVASCAVAAIGVLVLAGWATDTPVLIRLFPGRAAMAPATAACLILAGAGVGILRGGGASAVLQRAARLAGLVITAVGAWNVAQHLASPDLGVHDALDAAAYFPRRMSVATAVSFVLLGCAVTALNVEARWARLTQWCASLSGMLGLLVLFVYAYGQNALRQVQAFSTMAIHTALSFVIIAVGVLCAWGTAGPLGVLVAPSLGGMLSRRALPIAALLPLLAGWFSINGDRAGRFEIEFAFAFVALVNTVVSAGLGIVAGAWLHRLDARRATSELELRKSEQHFRALAESLPGLVWTCRGDGPCDYLSPQWVTYTGLPEHEQLGFRWLEQLHPDDREPTIMRWKAAAATGTNFDVEFRIRRSDGTYRWFKTRAVPLRGEDSQIRKWIGTNTDIQDERDARDALAKLNEELEARVEARTAELRAANQALHLVTRQLNAAQTITRVGSWDWDVDRDTVLWSEELFALFGLEPRPTAPSREERAEHFRADDLARLQRATERTRDTGEGYELELELSPRGGGTRIIVARGERIDSEGSTHLIGTFQDITELKRAQEQRERALQRARLATGAANMGIWEMEGGQQNPVWDDRMHEMYGVPTGDGRDLQAAWLARIHPEDRERVAETLRRAASAAGDLDFSFRITRDSRVRHIRRVATLHRGPDGRVLRMVGLDMDTTAQHDVEAELRANEALLREFVKHAPAAIAMLDRELRYIQASDRWIADYNLDPADLVARCHYDLFPNLPERWKEVHRRVLAGAVEKCDEDIFTRMDGSREWLQWEARPWRRADGEVGGLIFFGQIITARKRMELELVERKLALERSNQELEQFAYVASHDLQEPLRAIAGCGQILQRRYASGQLDDSAEALIQHMVEGASRMQRLVLDLLAYSRLATQPVEPSSIDSDEALRRALAQLGAAISESGATVQAGPLPRVRADQQQLAQVFQNLIGNAIKYRSDEPPRIEVSARQREDHWEFSVSDNGIGIEPKYFERIFVIFQRLHTRREYPGTGIGLAVCKKVIERHGGRIWVESAPGHGSTFRFTLPSGEANNDTPVQEHARARGDLASGGQPH